VSSKRKSLNRCCRPLFALLVYLFLFSAVQESVSQNITPKPTSFDITNAVKPKTTPTPISRMNVEMQRFVNVRLEASSDTRMVFSAIDDTVDNKHLYVWDLVKEQYIDTGEEGLSKSVIMPSDGRYMIFLYDETDALRDLNGDGTKNVIMRMYHFSTGQRMNLDLPARSATPGPGETRATFEYNIKNNFLVYAKSDSLDNSQRNITAPWQIINMLDIVYAIEGTPTPAPTATPIKAGTPTPTPTPTIPPTPTIRPTVPPEYHSQADINSDGQVNTLDLLLFQYFWKQ
jgi:hypothetical protein